MSEISAIYALAHAHPNIISELSDTQVLVLEYAMRALSLRPNQRVPRTAFDTWGIIAGRGFGKSHAIAYEINRRVEAGEARSLALMAPNEDRVKEVQADFLVSMSPPWFRAEHYDGGVRWPNGVTATAFTPEAPGRTRSGNFDTSWLCELVDWKPSTRLEAFHNVVTATRVGKAQVLWDTTSKGRNDVIAELIEANKANPEVSIIVRGALFDNPMLSPAYMRRICRMYRKGSRRYGEEVLGEVHTEAAGALWEQAWLDEYRVLAEPHDHVRRILSLDPALSDHADADETGICEGLEGLRDQIYITGDYSGKMKPDAWATIIVSRCLQGASGVVYERNHAGDMPHDLIKVKAEAAGLSVVTVPKDKPIPPRRDGTVYIKGVTSGKDKGARAAPAAALAKDGRVHHVGKLDKLEAEMTEWEPGQRSPNRLDACAQLIAEIEGLDHSRPDESHQRKLITDADTLQRSLRAMLAERSTNRRMR